MSSFRALKNGSKGKQPIGTHTESTPELKLFVHIPKTAGTSFRVAAEAKFGASRVLRDYGPKSNATTDAINTELYPGGDFNRISDVAKNQDAILVAGHFPLAKYASIIGSPNTIAIFRDPVDQVVSHYRHAVRDHGYSEDILTFARQPGIVNLQSRLMGNIDPGLLGIVGLTESYRDTLEILNHHWAWKLRHKKKNVSGGLWRKPLEVEDEQKAEIECLNDKDRAVFTRASRIFYNSLDYIKNESEADYRGLITLANTEGGVGGWAFDMLSDKQAEVDILVNSQEIDRIRCCNFEPTLAPLKPPRSACGGFSFVSSQLSEGDLVEIRDVEHGLILDRKTVTEKA